VATRRTGGSGARGGRGRGASGGSLDNKQIIGRVVLVSLVIAVVLFAVQGGEYGTTDIVRQYRALARERVAVDSLEAEVTRLQAYRKAVEGDPATQERIAREEFGMVRGDREMLYRFTDPARPDSTP
jgi:cell division protein FtsB